MKEIIKQSKNFTRKHAMNIKNGYPLSELGEGEIIKLYACAVVTDLNSEGEEKTVSCLVDSGGRVYSGISTTVLDTVNDLCDIVDEEEISVEVIHRKTKSGREFLTLMVY